MTRPRKPLSSASAPVPCLPVPADLERPQEKVRPRGAATGPALPRAARAGPSPEHLEQGLSQDKPGVWALNSPRRPAGGGRHAPKPRFPSASRVPACPSTLPAAGRGQPRSRFLFRCRNRVLSLDFTCFNLSFPVFHSSRSGGTSPFLSPAPLPEVFTIKEPKSLIYCV